MSELPNAVSIVGIRIPFWQLVGLLVKLAIAAIPAMIILSLIAVAISILLGALGVALNPGGLGKA